MSEPTAAPTAGDASPANGLCLRLTFPFGRYAATPWFRSRREHVDNVEWPPSPWRLVRALTSVAWNVDGADEAEVHALVRRLATAEPVYRLPPVGLVHYTQWMPRLDYTDLPHSVELLDNGHSMFDVDPDKPLDVVFPDLELEAEEVALLDRLLAQLTYLGQSVSVCVAERVSDPGGDRLDAWPVDPRQRKTEARLVRLLAPEPTLAFNELIVDTVGGELKSQPAPRGSRWVTYAVRDGTAAPREASVSEPQVASVVYLLHGVLRPPVSGLDRVAPSTIDPDRLLCALGRVLKRGAVRPLLLDDDGDGRAERLVIDLGQPDIARNLRSVLDPQSDLRIRAPNGQMAVDCYLTLEEVRWRTLSSAATQGPRTDESVLFRLQSDRRPLLADAVAVADSFHRRLLGAASRRWGTEAIPARLSGREPDGKPLATQHQHAHVLLGSADGCEITHVAVWAIGGFTDAERDTIAAVTLPALSGARIRLLPTETHPAFATTAAWNSATPFLPIRHPRVRGGRLVDGVEDQVRLELRRRGLPEPEAVRLTDQDWRHMRTTRRARDGSRPGLGAHGVEIEFAEQVDGPLALGANCHYGMGLFVPRPD